MRQLMAHKRTLIFIKTQLTSLMVKNPSAIADINDYAGVIANSVGNISIAPSDMAITDSDGDKILTINAKSGVNKTQDSDSYETGTATAGSPTSLTDTGAAFPNRENKVLHITAGTGVGKSAKILAGNTSNVLSFADIGLALDSTSKYKILDDLVIVYTDSVNSKVKLVKEETTDQAVSVSSGNPVNFSASNHVVRAPKNVA